MSDEMIDETHDPALASWVENASGPTDFPIQNLPFGIYSRDHDGQKRVGVAIGGFVLDVAASVEHGLIDVEEAGEAFRSETLNVLMGLPPSVMRVVRRQLSEMLRQETSRGQAAAGNRESILVPMSEVSMHLPADIGDYTDFYASVHHASNVGSMFRPDNPLLPNYKYVPIGYHGRASSIVPTGTGIRRPSGQTKAPDADAPVFGASKLLDYESELGFFVRGGNVLGEPVPMGEADSHIFGFCLVNDWSARDIQAWEYQPLGPFLAKNFATSVSAWVITSEAVAPYRAASPPRPPGDPPPLEYLRSPVDENSGALSAFLEVYLLSERMRDEGVPPVKLSRAPFSSMYWTVAQIVTHHASNGCNLRPGDLIASGTVSGDTPDSRGCLLELTWRGTQPLTLPTGEERKFLADGDEVIMKGSLEAAGRVRLGFGECRGIVLPAA